MITIERMTAETVEYAAALERLCFSRPWSREAIACELVNPLAVYLVARLEGEPAGYAGMHDVAGEGYVTNVAVSPEYRRRGVASALVGALLEYGAENALDLLTLEVRESNHAARQLYAGFGFVPVGLRKGFYEAPTEDAIIMTKELKH
jgi:ribosomal-protein-alanine N-acetyltransferase